ncbi:MAG: PHP domain-containing protein [Candidatus Omnitrophica bacterium]|nr:PHP domain-containing protein [Candidatus Omnitrophota bacterium]
MNDREDWHIHTIYSRDSISSPYRVVDNAVKKGLRKICVTDHDTIKGGKIAAEYAFRKGLNIEVVPGAEIKTDRGEIVGLGLKEEIKSRKLEEVIKEIKNQGGKILIPHPYGSIRKTRRKYKLEEVALHADYIELYNGRSFFINFRKKKIEEIAHKYNLKMVAGSDAHFVFEIGNVKYNQMYKGIIGFFITGVLNFIYPKSWRRI